MEKKKPVSYLIDFDSTFIQSEGLDFLAEISLKDHPEHEKRIKQIKRLTQQGMEGKIPFAQSLRERIVLLQTDKKKIQKAALLLKKQITPSIKRNKIFFKEHRGEIYIISGGFKELILPVVKMIGIPSEHVYANEFIYDAKGKVIGIDETNLMSQTQGKVKTVQMLKLTNDLYIIGDGYTDFELRKLGLAKKFIAFTENVLRENVAREADQIAQTFDEFLFVNKLPRTFSYPKNRIVLLAQTDLTKNDINTFAKEGYQIVHTVPQTAKTKIIYVDTFAIQSQNNLAKTIAIVSQKKVSAVDLQTLSTLGIAVFVGKTAAKQCVQYINSGSTNGCLSLPKVQLTQYNNAHRLLHIHKNVPGILSQINAILADHKCNILGQYLKTKGETGYVIVDIDKEYDKEVLNVLKKIPQTIRFRIIYN